jgi:hypothetical protein
MAGFWDSLTGMSTGIHAELGRQREEQPRDSVVKEGCVSACSMNKCGSSGSGRRA